MSLLRSSQFEGLKNGAIYSRNNEQYLDFDFNKPTVLMLYPKDFTPHCTNELKAARKNWEKIKATGVQFLAASTDSPEVHEVFFSEIGYMPYPVLTIAPRHKNISRFVNEEGYTSRTTLYFKDGNIVMRHRVPLNSERPIKKMLEAIDLLMRGKI